jgi:ABC-type ATPase with predicted acetyltransferase domain
MKKIILKLDSEKLQENSIEKVLKKRGLNKESLYITKFLRYESNKEEENKLESIIKKGQQFSTADPFDINWLAI